MNLKCRNFLFGIFFSIPDIGVHDLDLDKPEDFQKKTGKKKAL
jgi:hypothetical protein